MEFWAHSDGFFAKVSFTTIHLLLAVMAMLYLSLMNFKYTLNSIAAIDIESQILIYLTPCNMPFPFNITFNLSILYCMDPFSFCNCAIFSSFAFISCFNFSMFPFNPLISPTFRLTCDIAWTRRSVLGPNFAVGGTSTNLFNNSVYPCDRFTFSCSSCNALTL
jgi:hypothetical protein